MEHTKTLAHISCEDVFKIYKVADLEVVALRGLDLEVERGEIVAIVGASGSGKSTLLNILAGYDLPSAGKVSVLGRDLLSMNSAEVEKYRRTEVGFIWQQTGRNMFPYLTAIENVELPMMLIGEVSAKRRQRAEELLELVGLSDRMSHAQDKLSGGEQQRVAIAISLANNPPLLLADEPTGNLDSKSGQEIMDVFDALHQEGNTIVLVTHEDYIAAHANRTIQLFDGKIVDDAKATI